MSDEMVDETVKGEAESPYGENIFKRFFTRTLSVEQRALLGTLVFIAIVVAVGWVALNEPKRMETFTAQYDARSIQRGATIFISSCSGCHGARGEGLTGIAPALNASDLFDGTRLTAMGWTGSLEDYVELTIAAGRPARSSDWPNPMPTWSQDYGGPLRPDQVRDVAHFVLNWGLAYEEGYVEEPVAAERPTPIPRAAPEGMVGTDLETPLPEGDAVRGQALFSGQEPAAGGTLTCFACHTVDGSTLVGPSLLDVKNRLPEGYDSIEAYLRESILLPDTYKSPGFETAVMSANFGDLLNPQNLADVIAYLLTLE